jgi:uncharacterized protein
MSYGEAWIVMRIDDIIWLPQVIDKLAWKHRVAPEEVDAILFSNPMYRKVQKGHILGEDLYAALGQTQAGRYLIVFFIYKSTCGSFQIPVDSFSGPLAVTAISGDLLSAVISIRYIFGFRKDNPNVFNSLIQNWPHF